MPAPACTRRTPAAFAFAATTALCGAATLAAPASAGAGTPVTIDSITKLTPPPGSGNLLFGFDVARDQLGDLAVVGAPKDDDLGDGAGAVLVFAFDVPCSGDLDGSGSVGIADLLRVLAGFGTCTGCPQDLDGDGFVSFGDVLAILGAWGACP